MFSRHDPLLAEAASISAVLPLSECVRDSAEVPDIRGDVEECLSSLMAGEEERELLGRVGELALLAEDEKVGELWNVVLRRVCELLEGEEENSDVEKESVCCDVDENKDHHGVINGNDKMDITGVVKDNKEVIGMNNLNEDINDTNKDINKDIDKDIDKDTLDINKDIDKDINKDINNDTNKDIDKDIDKDTLDINKDIDKDINKDINNDTNKDIDKDINKDTLDINKDITKDTNNDTNNDINHINITAIHNSPTLLSFLSLLQTLLSRQPSLLTPPALSRLLPALLSRHLTSTVITLFFHAVQNSPDFPSLPSRPSSLRRPPASLGPNPRVPRGSRLPTPTRCRRTLSWREK